MDPSHDDDILARNDTEELAQLAVAIALDPPEDTHPGHAERILLQLTQHTHPNVRGNAILGFGHLGRTAGVIREADRVHALVSAALLDPDPYVAGHADSAASDLAFFLGWRFPGFETDSA